MVLAMSSICAGQDLKKHQWQQRLLLIYANNKNTKQITKQLNILASQKEGLLARKLLIYQFVQKEYSLGFDNLWTPSNKLPIAYKQKSDGFEVVLIGLDGSVKFRNTKTVSLSELFSIIDSMPMRQRELKNQLYEMQKL